MTNSGYIHFCWLMLLCLLLFGSTPKCSAQTPHVYSFSELTNFEPKIVYHLLEDRQGNIWISTEQGLYKYDGVAFKKYTHPSYSSELGKLHEDRDGRIWSHNFTGQVFYIEKDSLKLFKDLSEYVTDYVCITSVDFPKIYATTLGYGYLEMDFYSKKITHRNYQTDKNSARNRITKQGDTLFYESILVYKLFPQKLHLYRYPYLLEVDTKTKDTTLLATLQDDWDIPYQQTIYRKGEKLLLAMSDMQKKGLLLEYGEKGLQKTPAPYDLLGGFAANILLIEENETLWLSTSNGLVVLDKQYRPIYGSHKILPGKNITEVIKDREGNYWIATKEYGIFIIPSTNILTWDAENSTLLTNEIKAIEKDNEGNIYLGQIDRNLFCMTTRSRKPQYLTTMNRACENMLYDPYRNRIWWRHTPAYYDLNHNQIVAIPTSAGFSKDFSFIDPNNVVVSHSKLAYIANFSAGIGKYPPMDSLWRNSSLKYEIFYSPSMRNYPLRIIELRGRRSMDNEYDPINKTIWVSYVDGLYRYKNAKEKEIRWQEKPILPTTLTADIKGGVWLGSLQNQLLKVEDTGEVILKKDSLPTSIIKIKQWKQYLFLATKQGIYKFNTKNNQLELFNHLDGLPSNDINDLEIVNDTVYAATMGGVAIFPAKLSTINKTSPTISITGFSVKEEPRTLQDQYWLPFEDNNLSISFNALATRSQGMFQYQYRMLGLDSTWITTRSSTNFARYPSLPSGDYTFEVKAVNEDGIASNPPAKLQLSIATPYYRTWWFVTLIALGITSIFSTLFILRLQAVRKENKIQKVEKELVQSQKEAVESQLSALRSQMNPHFIFNALNSIQSYIISQDKAFAAAYLGRFADLMRLYLNHSNIDYIKLSEEIDALKRYLELENIRFEDDLTYTITLDEKLIPEDITIPSMLLQPFVENALKHGLLHKKGAKRLTLAFQRKGANQLLCIIEDNGIGRKKSAEINQYKRKPHKSFATSAIENRLKLLNQEGAQKIEANIIDLYDKNGKALGTRVELYIILW